MADPRRGNQLEHRVEHPEPRTQHWHDHHAISHAPRISWPNRCLNAHRNAGNVARRLRRQQKTDAHGHVPECLGGRRDLAEGRKRVVDERVLNQMHGHGVHYTAVDSRQSTVVSLSPQSESPVASPSRQSESPVRVGSPVQSSEAPVRSPSPSPSPEAASRRTANPEPRVPSPEPRTANREPRAANREPRAASWKLR